MGQTSFVDGALKKHHKRTRKKQTLVKMEQIVPWKDLAKVIALHYSNPKGAGCRPLGVECMRRLLCLEGRS